MANERKTSLVSNMKKNRAKLEKKERTAAIIKEVHTDSIKQVTVRMPESVHRQMKAKCALGGVAMNDFIVQLVQDALLEEL